MLLMIRAACVWLYRGLSFDLDVPPTPHPPTQVFFFDYRPAAGWYMRHVELGLLVILSAMRAVLPWPTALGSIALKAGLLSTSLLAALVTVLVVRPFLASEAWMGWVRALLLLVSLLCVTLNAAAGAVFIDLGGVALRSALDVGAVIAFCASVATMAVLFGGVAWHVYSDALAERRRLDASRARLRRFEQQRMRALLAGGGGVSTASPSSTAHLTWSARGDATKVCASTPPSARLLRDGVDVLGADEAILAANVEPAAATSASHRSLKRGSVFSSRQLLHAPQLSVTLRAAAVRCDG